MFMALFWLALAVWQVQRPGGGGGGGAAAVLCNLVFMVVWLAVIVAQIAGMWKAFEKAGKPGWAAIVPFYNLWVMVEIAEKPQSWFFLILCVPCANIIFQILLLIEIANKFGQGAGFGVGLAFLPMIFWPLLGFGSAQYEGGRRRRRRDYDEEDEDEDDRPRRRRARDEEDEDEDDRPRRRPRARDEDDDDDDDDRHRVRRRPRDDD